MNDKFFSLPAEKQQAILNAGYRVFSRNSYKNSPMSEIAGAAGISKALLFHYFHNKKELYLYLWEKSAETTIEYLTRDHPRTAIGYYAPGHYCLLSVAGYQGEFPGVSLEELSAFFASLGCRCAYNLDGGTSTHVWYHGREVGFPSQTVRLADLIYLEDLSSAG